MGGQGNAVASDKWRLLQDHIFDVIVLTLGLGPINLVRMVKLLKETRSQDKACNIQVECRNANDRY